MNTRRFACSAALLCTSAGAILAQPTGTSPLTGPPNGPRSADSTWHAFTNATVHVRPGVNLDKATVVIRNGAIVNVGGTPPAGARVWDCTGLHIYPGFIDACVEVDAPKPDLKAPGVHWNDKVTPQRRAMDGTGLDDASATALRKLGFTAAAIAPRTGVFRGMSAIVSLATPSSEAGTDRPPVYKEDAYHFVGLSSGGGFGGGGGGGGGYPGSQMGVIALTRQVLSDAAWQAEARRAGEPIPENALDSLLMTHGQWLLLGSSAASGSVPKLMPIVFDTGDELESLRASRVAAEFSRPAIILGSGYEFRRLDAIKKDDRPLIIPLNYPRNPDVSSIGKTESVELRDMMTWEQAPTNPRRLDAAGLKVALTTHRLRDRAQFSANLQKAIKHGLAPDRALAMLTTQPAEILAVSDRLGTIEAGKIANLVIADGDLFAPDWKAGDKPADEANPDGDKPEGDKAEGEKPDADKPDAAKDEKKSVKVREVWIDGYRHEINPAPIKEAVGTWIVAEADGQPIEPKPDTPTLLIDDKNAVTIKQGDKRATAKNVKAEKNRIAWTYDDSAFGRTGVVIDNATVEGDAMIGLSLMTDGSTHRWKAKRTSTEIAKDEPPARAGGERAGPGGRPRIAGVYQIATIDGNPAPDAGTIEITRDNTIKLARAGRDITPEHAKVEGDSVEFSVDHAKIGDGEGIVQHKATVRGDTLSGAMITPDGASREWTATRVARSGPPEKTAEQKEKEAIAAIPENYGYPFGPYALDSQPPQAFVAIKGGIVWTSGPAGVIENGVVLIGEGKILFAGSAADYDKFLSSARLKGQPTDLDATGKHITPGIIDCHSHTGISGGVNEGSQACTAEVRIQDVTNPDAINWYRQLAGGVTAVNNLHGSANPIGGQNCVNKIRWGAVHPDDMHFEGAKSGIKFALGENVKQSNWDIPAGERTRYPQTRMGVESLIRDRFVAAREYARQWSHYPFGEIARRNGHTNGTSSTTAPNGHNGSKIPPRRDLELEALAEILAGDRLIHCHSYRQDEILMLARLAQEFGFRIGTYQHNLEGYKVAEAVRDSALGASLFSDWWNYKVEVQDAIPQAGPIMWEVGNVVSYNSDSDELARRMNVEAGKAVKYGGLKPEEALKFVTLNPAIQLAVDNRVGSLEAGKDADLAIWSGPPLSSLSRCEATYVDGRCLFSLEQDKAHRATIAKERQRLIQKLLADSGDRPSAGGPPGGGGFGGRRRPTDASEDPRLDYYRARVREHYLDMLRRGIDPESHKCGDCGMGALELMGAR